MNGRVWKYWVFGGGGLAFLAALSLVVWPVFSGKTAVPGLLSSRTDSNYLAITITNGVATNGYELLVGYEFNPAFAYAYSVTGAIGQTNFSVQIGPQNAKFIRARDCIDCDNDGILNWRDADPFSTNVGVLTITIESPANGSTLE